MDCFGFFQDPVQRPSAAELLQHPFLQPAADGSPSADLAQLVARAAKVRSRPASHVTHFINFSLILSSSPFSTMSPSMGDCEARRIAGRIFDTTAVNACGTLPASM